MTMKKIVLAAALATLFLVGCGKTEKTQEDREKIEQDIDTLKKDISEFGEDQEEADSLALREIREDGKNLDDKLEGNDDGANQGEFQKVKDYEKYK